MKKHEKVIFGINPVLEAINSGLKIKKVWLETGKTNSNIEDIVKQCKINNISFGEKSSRFLEKLAKTPKHQGVIAFYIPKDLTFCFENKNYTPRTKNFLCVYLDRIQDPQNFGAIIRSSEYFAVDQIFYPEFYNAPYNSIVIKASAGASMHNPPFKITSINNFFSKIKENNFQIIGTSPQNGKYMKDIDFNRNTLVIIGNEGEGISDKVEKHCDDFIKIPNLGRIDSLNASVSTGIVLYQIQQLRM